LHDNPPIPLFKLALRAIWLADALVKFRREPLDLVVLDHRLSDRTGLEPLVELKSLRPNLPVIMLTGYGSERISAAAFKLGVTEYFPKPVRGGELVVAAADPLAKPGEERGPVRGPDADWVAPSALFSDLEGAMGLIHERYWGPSCPSPR
jgi:DNA-binding NtrC family response regulator